MIEGEKEGGKHSLWPSLACFFFLLFLPPAGHLFPVCNMTPVPDQCLGSGSLEVCVCVCTIVGFLISCYANAASHLCWYKVAHVLSCDSSVI